MSYFHQPQKDVQNALKKLKEKFEFFLVINVHKY